MTEAESPAPEPKNSLSAGVKSPVDIPCRYISGSTSATLGLLRHHGGTMAERNRQRSPVSESIRRSSTRGAWISIPPAAVAIVRGSAWPLRTTRRRPCSSSSPVRASTYPDASISIAAISIRRAPSRTISSSPAVASSARASSLVTTVNIGVSFLAGVSPPANLVLVNEEGTPRLRTGGRSTGSGYNSPAIFAGPRRRFAPLPNRDSGG